MTVVVQTPYNAHLANGVTTLFGFTFQLLDEGDLQVSLDGVVQMGGFTISGLGVQAGGSVTFSLEPANNVLVELQRRIPLSRSTDYQQNGDLPEAVLDLDFDRLWQAMQDQTYFAGLTVGLPAGDAAAPMILPSVAERANKFFAFDAGGAAIAALGTPPEVPVTSFAATLLDDETAADARDTLGALSNQMATARALGRVTAGVGDVEQLTSAQVTASLVDAATTTAAGKVELATDAEAQAGTDATRAVTPDNLGATVLGLGQSWTDQTGARSQSTNYTNSTGRTIAISVIALVASTGTLTLTVGGVVIQSMNNGVGGTVGLSVSGVIQPGAVYSVAGGSSITGWRELR